MTEARRSPQATFGLYTSGGVYFRATPQLLYQDAFFLDMMAAAGLVKAMELVVADRNSAAATMNSHLFSGMMRSATTALEAVWDALDESV